MQLESTDLRYRRVVQTLVTLLEGRNPYNVDHCKLVAHYSELTARRAGADSAIVDRVKRAAELHTVGLLLQMEEKRLDQSLPAALDTAHGSTRDASMIVREEQILRGLLSGVADLEPCIDIIVQRHEWFDGSGSTHGLSGKGILDEARILAVADAFVDLATPKSHRAPVTLNEVLQRIRDQSGSQFDPQYAEALASAVMDEEERWGASARARRFEASRCRHWLFLGHFYRQSGETQWAFRCYVAAQRLAEDIKDVDLEMSAVTGLFLGYCDLGEFDRAREVLTAARKRAGDASGAAKHALQLLWGLLECHQGHEENGLQILEGLVESFQAQRDVEGLAAATGLVANVLLMHRGVNDKGHVQWLRRFMDLIARHDLFDVIIRYRPQTIPLLLSAIINEAESVQARAILTRMGEPCHGSLQERLTAVAPAQWMDVLRPPTALPTPMPAVRKPAALESDKGAAAARIDMRIACLGTFLVTQGEGRITEEDWPTQKAMRLFALLAFRRNATIPCREIIDDLWPDRDEQHARSSLRNAVHQIRGLLKGLLADGAEEKVTLVRNRKSDTLTLRGEYLLDTDAFDSAVAEATLTWSLGRHEETVNGLKTGLALYRGDFLENMRDDWSEGPRARLAETHLKGLQILAKCYITLGDPEAAELVARRILSSDDLREEAHATLIESLSAQGRHGDAIRHYHDAVKHLHAEIGLAAPAQLTALYNQLLAKN